MLYRIQTESDHVLGRYRRYRENIIEIVSRYFDGFTIVDAIGYREGKPEHSIIIEIIAENELPKIRAIADEIRIANKQECVLVSSVDCRVEFACLSA